MTKLKKSGWLLFLLLGLAPLVSATDLVPGEPQSRPVLLKGGDLYTVSGGIREGTDLLFDKGRIVEIGVGIEPPVQAEVIDIAGQRVYPGIIAPQTELGLIEIGAVRATNDRDEVGSLNPEVAAHVAYNPDSEVIPTVRSHGITTAQVVPRGELLRGQNFLTHLDGWTKEDSGVRLLHGMTLSWPEVQVNEGGWRPVPREKQLEKMKEERRILREAFTKARAYHFARAAGVEQAIDQRWEAMRPLWDQSMPLYVVAEDYRQIVEAIAFAEEWKLKLILVGGKEADRAASLLKDSEIPIVLGEIQSRPMREGDPYDAAFTLPARLHEAGVRFCFAQPSGFWSVRNLPFQAGQAVAFGLDPDVALRALTLTTAEILGVDDELGSLDVGKQATLFVSGGDILDMLTQDVKLMFIEGRRVDLDNRHKALYRKYDRR